MNWLGRLLGGAPPPASAFDHDAPELEAALPAAVAGRPMVRWSVAGEKFWRAVGGNRARATLVPELAALGVSPDEIAMAVAGRANTRGDPPYSVWVLKLGRLKGGALRGRVPSSIAMRVMRVDPTKGEAWRDANVAGRPVMIGNRAMVRQSGHQQGSPYVHFTETAIFMLIADDDSWAEEVIRALPAD